MNKLARCWVPYRHYLSLWYVEDTDFDVHGKLLEEVRERFVWKFQKEPNRVKDVPFPDGDNDSRVALA